MAMVNQKTEKIINKNPDLFGIFFIQNALKMKNFIKKLELVEMIC